MAKDGKTDWVDVFGKKSHPDFIAFTNRETGRPERLAVRRIIRVRGCPEPEHEGYALLDFEIGDVIGCIEADMKIEDFLAEHRGLFG